jgi:hypothetical protein
VSQCRQRLSIEYLSEAEVDISLHSDRELARPRQFDRYLHHIDIRLIACSGRLVGDTDNSVILVHVAMDMGMATWIVAVAVITTVGAEATIAVGDDR